MYNIVTDGQTRRGIIPLLRKYWLNKPGTENTGGLFCNLSLFIT